MRVADVKLKWKRSVSADVALQIVKVIIDGVETLSSELPPELESVSITVKASQNVQFSVTTRDDEGQETVSEVYTFQVGNLDAPAPATELGHEIVGIREEPDVQIDADHF